MQLKKTICTDAKLGLICATNDVIKAALGQGFTKREQHGHWLIIGWLYIIMYLRWDCVTCKPCYTDPKALSPLNIFNDLLEKWLAELPLISHIQEVQPAIVNTTN